MSTFQYSRNFRKKILALALDPMWFMRYGSSLLKPDFFEADDEALTIEAINQYVEAYGRPPRDPEDLIIMAGEETDELVNEIFSERDDYELDYVKDIVVQWAKEQAAKSAILESVDEVKRGNLSAVIPRMEEALKVGDDLLLPGISWVEDVDIWTTDAIEADKVPTGWREIDADTDGGVARGECGVLLAPTNRGKTMGLINLAFAAAKVGVGKNVLIISHEIRESVVAKRLGARLTHRFIRRNDDRQVYKEDFHYMARMMVPGEIRIVDNIDSIIGIRALLDRFRGEGFVPDLIIDDYADPRHLRPIRTYKDNMRNEHGGLILDLRKIAVDYNAAVWTASQAGRYAIDKEIVTEADVAEDIGKVNHADIVISICQTKKEKEEKRCRLYSCKVRDGARGGLYDAKFYGDSQAIIVTGRTQRKLDDDA